MQLPRLPSVCLLPLLLVLPLGAQTKADGGGSGWPFGKAAGGGAMARMQRQDLWNLGLIGAKAWDADKKLPGPRQGGRRRFASSKGDRAGDKGPQRLLIQAIYPGGPGAKAGLRLGDVVVGVGKKKFKDGSLDALAKALLKAESAARKNVVTLLVERAGKRLTLEIKIPKGGKGSNKPDQGEGRVKIFKSALKWLADHQDSRGGFPQTLGGNNGAIVMTCLAGLAWIEEGSTTRSGHYAENLRKAVDFVTQALSAPDPFGERRPGGANWDQSNWSYAHAAIFLGELYQHRKSKKLEKELQTIATTLCKRQEASGGYAHGPGGPNGLGYVELNIMAGFVLSGLGLSQQAGCQIDDKVVDRLLTYLKESSSGGGVGYSTEPGQKGQGNIGRTAGAWLGALTLGKKKAKFVQQMRAYTERRIDAYLEGHASLMQHILLAGVASAALGKKAEKRYWKAMRRDLILARAPDGSLQPRPWHESLLMGSNTDVSMGEVWTTASWAIVLGADLGKKKGGLPGWTGVSAK